MKTRQLNKLIFINSASVAYSEVALDGNIHFVGSNGFGKTTVLRAILFFYNPSDRKRDLGIREDQKAFSEYYFERSDSYIIYEVNHEAGPYCLVLYKRNGRLHVRFVESAYQRDWFISDYQANDQAEVWQNIQSAGVAIVPEEITRLGHLRQILYGAGAEKIWRRFALFKMHSGMQKRKTNNIPLAISNIFRSSRLDSNYIKKSIIDAVFYESIKPLDLSVIERQLARFRNDLKDLDSYQSQEDVAKEIIRQFNELEELKHTLDTTATNLGHKLKEVRAKIDRIDTDMEGFQQQMTEEDGKLKALQTTYDEQLGRLNGEIAVLKNELAETERLKSFFKDKDIETLVNKVKGKSLKEKQLIKLKTSLEETGRKVQDVAVYFENKLARLENEKLAFESQFSEKRHLAQATLLEAKTAENELFEQTKLEIEDQFLQRIVPYEKEVAEKRAQYTDLQSKLRGVEKQPLVSKEHQQLLQEIGDLEQQGLSWDHEHKMLLQEISSKKELYALKVKHLESDTHAQKKRLQKSYVSIEEQLHKVETQLKGYEGSLLSFLHEQVDGWEAHLGKVLKEEVLFSKNLSPAFDPDQSNNLFGLSLNLADLPSTSHSIEQLEALKKGFSKQLKSIEVELSQLEADFLKESEELQQAIGLPVKKLQNRVDQLRYDQERCQVQVKNLKLEVDALSQKEQAVHAENLHQIHLQLDEVEGALKGAEQQLQAVKQQQKEELLALQGRHRTTLAQAEEHCSKQLQGIAQEANERLKLWKEEKEDIRKDRDAQMAGKGIDPDRVRMLEHQIETLTAELEEIDDEAIELVNRYKFAQERYLDVELDNVRKLADAEGKVNQLAEDFRLKSAGGKRAVKELQMQMGQQRQLRKELNALIAQDFEYFKTGAHSVYHVYQHLIDHPKGENTQGLELKESIHLMNSHFSRLTVETTQLQRKLNKFTGLFSLNNFLNFPKKLEKDQDYLDFVRYHLEPFVTNNMVELARKQLEKLHADTINDIAREVKDFSTHSTEIHAVIAQINADFESSNFVGVVKSIQLDFREKNAGVIQLMRKIKKLTEDHQFGAQAGMFNKGLSEDISQESIKLLTQLKSAIDDAPKKIISIHDTFDLWFRVEENNNDTGWVERLSNVGSEGTDVMVKAMIYITLLNVFKLNAFRTDSNYCIHCMIDEVGKLSDRYLRELINFTNDKNIRLIFGSPNENDPLIYQHVYKVHREDDHIQVIELIGEEQQEAS
ncbi:ATP-binding protein [Persicobacter psychrovividus]|uniref:ATP-binding protein n=1 Tax=Persicobacter psychrovividus TaxID=387638 RepID=A0ABM7VKL1_9BACT|nr:ATP-binding protein [Persicobacter psychrovividus]